MLKLISYLFYLSESGRLEFPEFVTLAAKFIVEEDAEAMQKELREAFRLYDKEGKFFIAHLVAHHFLNYLLLVNIRNN